MMFKLFGVGSKEEQKIAKVQDDPFPKAIESLNKLVNFFQEYENSQGNSVLFELSRHWNKTQLFGSETFGIEGQVELKNLKGSAHNLDLFKSLHNLGFRLGANSSSNNSFSGSFHLYHLHFIEGIPANVDSIIEDYQELLNKQISGFRNT